MCQLFIDSLNSSVPLCLCRETREIPSSLRGRGSIYRSWIRQYCEEKIILLYIKIVLRQSRRVFAVRPESIAKSQTLYYVAYVAQRYIQFVVTMYGAHISTTFHDLPEVYQVVLSCAWEMLTGTMRAYMRLHLSNRRISSRDHFVFFTVASIWRDT